MTTIAILQEAAAGGSILYRAVARRKESVGRTVGEALDALTSQLSEDEAGTLVIVQNFRPDHYFTARQQQRLTDICTSQGREGEAPVLSTARGMAAAQSPRQVANSVIPFAFVAALDDHDQLLDDFSNWRRLIYEDHAWHWFTCSDAVIRKVD